MLAKNFSGLFLLTFFPFQCIIKIRNGFVTVQLLLKRGARFFFIFIEFQKFISKSITR